MEAVDVTSDSREQARGALRDGRIRYSVRAGLLGKAVSVASRMAVVAVAIRALGPERYGLWVSAGSLVGWLGVSDLGLSSGIINSVSKALGGDDRAEARRHLSTGYALFTALGIGAACAVLALANQPVLYRVLGIPQHGDIARDARFLFIFLGLVFAVSLPAGVVVSASNAFQQAYLASMATTVAQGTTLLALMALLISQSHNLAALVAAVALPPLLANLVLSYDVFGRRHRDLCPALSSVGMSSARTVVATSTFIFLGQLGDLAIHYSSNLVIASHFGPSTVPRYSVAYSLFMVAQTLCTTLLGPLWPFYAEAAVRGDQAWIQRTFRISVFRTVAIMLTLTTGIVVLGRPVIRIWAGEAAVPGYGLLAAMAFYFMLWMLSAVTWMLAYGLGFFRLRALSSLSSGAVFVAGSLAMVGRLGLLAVPLAGSAAMIIDYGMAIYTLRIWQRSLN